MMDEHETCEMPGLNAIEKLNAFYIICKELYEFLTEMFCKTAEGIPRALEYRMVFLAGLRDPCTRDVARLLESVKILEPQASVFLRFPKVEQHPK
jgi:hypothetical protein